MASVQHAWVNGKNINTKKYNRVEFLYNGYKYTKTVYNSTEHLRSKMFSKMFYQTMVIGTAVNWHAV